ncbi:MAG TPA: WecB/TagA/CpsF family glycosyltransferase [Acidimicrobiales bacterium]|nr:WecB/TagA/CpsF family glycosyltransferase [Acidimicrobiales bacterium]
MTQVTEEAQEADEAQLPELALAPRARELVDVMGLQLDDLDEAQVVDHVMTSLSARLGGWMATPNVNILMQVRSDPELADIVAQADLVLADGMPLVWASRLQGTPLRQRVPGSDLLKSLSVGAAAKGFSIFLLGDDDPTTARAAANLMERAPGLVVAGRYSPPWGYEHDAAETERIVAELWVAAPDIVFVALGCPKQERLMHRLRPLFPSTWFVGIGAGLAMASGDFPVAPDWMRRAGLEWVHRLRLEPRRLFKRYLLHNAPFAVTMLVRSMVRGLRRRLRPSL